MAFSAFWGKTLSLQKDLNGAFCETINIGCLDNFTFGNSTYFFPKFNF